MKTAHDLYTLVKARYPEDELVLQYVCERKESVTCTVKTLQYIFNHFKQTLEHRKWLYYTWVLLSDSFNESEAKCIDKLIMKHDLSKFSAVEAVGYGWKFGRLKSSKPLKNSDHLAMWESALKHHYANNPHHPQYHSNQDMPTHYLLESIIDMLGCRLQRNLAGRSDLKVEDIFKIPDTYLERYTEADRHRVKTYLSQWERDITTSPHRSGLALRMLL